MNLNNMLKEMVRQIPELRKLYFPLLPKEKREYLKRWQDAVDEFKPGIEEKTGVELDDVRVKDFLEFGMDYFKHCYKDFSKTLEEEGRHKYIQACNKGFMAAVYWTIMPVPFITVPDLISARHFKGNIYVAMGTLPKMYMVIETLWDIPLGVKEDAMHELGHNLWWKIAGDVDTFERKKGWRDWNEGFATYCAQEWFKDLYPDGYEIQPERVAYRAKSLNNIKKLVSDHGDDILYKIPSEWQSFNS